eukprot:1160391-Pelagomonas_calceolata.AAC.8
MFDSKGATDVLPSLSRTPAPSAHQTVHSVAGLVCSTASSLLCALLTRSVVSKCAFAWPHEASMHARMPAQRFEHVPRPEPRALMCELKKTNNL